MEALSRAHVELMIEQFKMGLALEIANEVDARKLAELCVRETGG